MSAKKNGTVHNGEWSYRIRLYYEKHKKESTKDRMRAIDDNYWRRKEHMKPDPVPRVFTWEEFASNLQCNANTLRRFANGAGIIDAEIINRFIEHSAKKDSEILNVKVETPIRLPLNKIAICAYRKCNETIILWAHNKKYCCPNHGTLERKLKKREPDVIA